MKNPHYEHENWVRYHSVDLSIRINRFASATRVLDDAEKIARFILQKPECDVLALNQPTGKGEIKT
jgi:hypothetical protein